MKGEGTSGVNELSAQMSQKTLTIRLRMNVGNRNLTPLGIAKNSPFAILTSNGDIAEPLPHFQV